MNEMNELYKNIPGYNGKYQVSNLGNVRSLQCKEPRILQQFDRDKCGHKYVELCKDGVSKKFLIHRLVAEAFIPNPDNLPCINHKDKNPANNEVSNLEWCTNKYNVQYSLATKVKCIETGITYNSIRDTAVALNISHTSVIRALQSHRDCKGYNFIVIV